MIGRTIVRCRVGIYLLPFLFLGGRLLGRCFLGGWLFCLCFGFDLGWLCFFRRGFLLRAFRRSSGLLRRRLLGGLRRVLVFRNRVELLAQRLRFDQHDVGPEDVVGRHVRVRHHVHV